MKKNVALIGMMGCGKTTTAKELSKIANGYSAIDLDEEIEKSTGKKISEIFLKFGEPHFRMLESDKIKLVVNKDKIILSLGGGAFESEENRELILKNCTVIYLKTSADTIYERIKNEVHRPLLRKNFSKSRIQDIMKFREKNYEKADVTVVTDNKSPNEVAQEILRVIE